MLPISANSWFAKVLIIGLPFVLTTWQYTADAACDRSSVEIQLVTQPDKAYVLEVSDDLTKWTPLTTIWGLDLLTPFFEATDASVRRRFYRARVAEEADLMLSTTGE